MRFRIRAFRLKVQVTVRCFRDPKWQRALSRGCSSAVKIRGPAV